MKLGSVSIKAVQWNYFLLIYPSLLGVVLLNNISASSGASEKMSNLTDPVELAPGTFITGENREFYEQFLGIPFAKPPLGALRFRNPEPFPLWTGNRSALTAGPNCWQYEIQLGIPLSGSEDCLYLNVYRPKVGGGETNKPLNVILFIHGGGFYSGTSNPLLYGPDYFMETGEVILVATNYRVNVFGFLATGDEASPGNYGLKDQTMAMRWIKDNIAAFGGDPNKVTLMGHSAGSVSVNYHLLSKQSEGLFKNAILLSGVATTPWGLPLKNPREFVDRHARTVNISNPEKMTSAELVDKLREIPAEKLTAALKDTKEWDILPITSYLPAVEAKGTPDAFLTEDPRNAMKNGGFTKVPVLADILPNDGINFVQPFLTPEEKYRELNLDMYKILPVVLYMNSSNVKMKEIVDKVRDKYFGTNGVVEGGSRLEELHKLGTDYMYRRPLYRTLQQLSKNSDKQVYAFQWNYQGLSSFGPVFTRSDRKSKPVHADELISLFRIRLLFEKQLSAEDEKAKDLLMKSILNFVKNNDPGWEPWTKDQPKIAVFRNDNATVIAQDTVAPSEMADAFEFWEEIQKLYEQGERVEGN